MAPSGAWLAALSFADGPARPDYVLFRGLAFYTQLPYSGLKTTWGGVLCLGVILPGPFEVVSQ